MMFKDSMGLSGGGNIKGREQGEGIVGVTMSQKLEELEQVKGLTLERGRNPSSSNTGLSVVAYLPNGA